ncbi:MAG TPA: lyase family protein, partial [Myxococcota bacterium]|nr:lyase family protein [Myxococcota bacterium]
MTAQSDRSSLGANPRIERDSLGEVAVPAEAYWGAQTQRALEHFAIGRERMPHALIHAYALIKQAAAEANAALGELPPAQAEWIQRAAQDVLDGRL